MAQRYYGLLFGLPKAVTSFNRWSKLAEALVRRVLLVLLSMYFDDATMQDWADRAADAQRCVSQFMRLVGDPPGAKGKSQPCRAYGDFLGLIHDLAEVQSGTIRFWSRAALIVKVADILALALQTGLDSS